MANIQTLNDFRNPRNNGRLNPIQSNQQLSGNQPNPQSIFQQQPITIQNIKAAQQHKVMFLSGVKRLKNPLQENYCDMLKETCCPVLKCLSFTTFILIVNLVMFIISLAIGIKREGELLQIKSETLIQLGGNYPPGLKNGEVYRLLGAIVLHANFLHILGNCISTLIFVSRVQYTYGSIKTGIFYVVCGISGNIFSALASSQGVKVGASTSLYGILGLIVGYVVINWSGLDKVGPLMKCQLVFVMIIVVVFILIFTSASENIDIYGHIGGFLAGLWLSAFHATIIEESYEKIIRVIFIILLCSQFLILFLVFYLKP